MRTPCEHHANTMREHHANTHVNTMRTPCEHHVNTMRTPCEHHANTNQKAGWDLTFGREPDCLFLLDIVEK
jgi:hypothetical protein